MLVELGLVEQRLKAVHEVLDGATGTEVAKRNGVTRQTVHTWLRRVCEFRGRSSGGQDLQARELPPPDDRGGRGPDRRDETHPSSLGSEDFGSYLGHPRLYRRMIDGRHEDIRDLGPYPAVVYRFFGFQRGLTVASRSHLGSPLLRPGTTSSSWPRPTSTIWVENSWRCQGPSPTMSTSSSPSASPVPHDFSRLLG